ncbi:hypothetical protein EDB80DRAFT_689786 [Ilyonectria destructans]|nr:hypothetical protein EDB80DRAFT_689786 [Ilyonectria destructans]
MPRRRGGIISVPGHPDPGAWLNNSEVTKPPDTDDPSCPENCEVLDPDGDVILIVGEERKKIWVYSNFLRAISPRFKEMLQGYPGPGYDGGEDSRYSCLKLLPDDDALAMTQLLRALSRGGTGTGNLKPREIKNIGALVEKYDMASRLIFMGSYWLRDREMEDTDDYWCLLTAAYHFQLHEPFTRLSNKLIEHYHWRDPSLLEPATETPGTLIDFRLALDIEERRHWHARVSWGPTPGLCLDCFKTPKNPFSDEDNNMCSACMSNQTNTVSSASHSPREYSEEMEDGE